MQKRKSEAAIFVINNICVFLKTAQAGLQLNVQYVVKSYQTILFMRVNVLLLVMSEMYYLAKWLVLKTQNQTV